MEDRYGHEDSRLADLNEKFDQTWTRTFATFEVVSFALVAAVLICAAGAALLLAGVAAIYRPAALILAGGGLLYLAFVISTHAESS